MHLRPRVRRVYRHELLGTVFAKIPGDSKCRAHLPRVVETRVRNRERGDVKHAVVHHDPPVFQGVVFCDFVDRELGPCLALGIRRTSVLAAAPPHLL